MTESEHARALIKWWGYASKRYDLEPEDLYHIPNGGSRAGGKVEGARLKAEGVRAGMPDYHLSVSRGSWPGLFVELKTERGRTTPQQRKQIARLESRGYLVVVAHGWDDARQAISAYLETPRRKGLIEGKAA